MENRLGIAFKGMAMGMAEVIPGVSGGTIAFITGIYEKLLNSIKAFGPSLISTFRKDGFAGAWNTINGNFLVFLLGGMVLGIVVGVFGISFLLETYPPAVWAFFFGLIIASAIYVGKQIEKWRWQEVIALIIGTAVAYAITVISPAEGSSSYFFVFISGMIAISALILPGISGSFILLLMGMYSFIITDTLKPALKTLDPDKLVIMFVFALGCLTGLMTVSRLLSWTFKHFRSVTLAILTGFMLGSLNKIWPWRNATKWMTEEGGIIDSLAGGVIPKKILMEQNVLPSGYTAGEPLVLAVVICAILGFAAVFLLERFGSESKH